MNADTRPTQQTDATDGNLSHIVHMRRASDTSTNPNWPYSWRKTRNRLANFEVFWGILCISVGVITAALDSSGNLVNSRYRRLVIGEGIWCGFWITLAGILNVFAAKTTSRRLIIVSMSFSIVGTVFGALMAIISGLAILNAELVYYFLNEAQWFILSIISCVVAGLSVIFLIVSTVFTCVALRWCCPECYTPYPSSEGIAMNIYKELTEDGQRIVYAQQPAYGGQPVVYAQQPGVQPVTNDPRQASGGQPVAQMQQLWYPTNYAQQPAVAGQPIAYTVQPITHPKQLIQTTF